MTKPHEQEWTYNEDSRSVQDESGANIALNLDPDDGRFVAAAPDMARVLLNVCKVFSGSSIAKECVSALRKAGVLP